ncbi:M1 family metallopeptidase [Fictibacillus enclensis]|uniref:M1 family metallopeptidase n=1 Tax=Fictibacillus enclensis TaxID=1017270 RepID=UPI0025A2A63A|nr:M1 family metallopeptidase [Fictibacillus enclensis]MDM5335819.1 M1 family metallopeptidase [Fictibacillus enclensis]
MKKILVILLSIFVLGQSSAALAASPPREKLNLKAHPSYQIDAKYDSKENMLKGHLKVKFKNRYKKNLKEVRFNVWSNAKEYQDQGGSVTITNMKSNHEPVNFKLENSVLQVFTRPQALNKVVEIEFSFNITVPENNDRYGRTDKIVKLGNALPVLAVYDSEGWNTDPFYEYGDSFFAEASEYNVSFLTEKSMKVVSSGSETNYYYKNEYTLHTFKAKQARDFSLVLSKDFLKQTLPLKNHVINVYYLPEQQSQLNLIKQTTRDSFELFEKTFGKYPWKEFDVALTDGWFGGMEFSQFVMVSLYDGLSEEDLKFNVAHEIAHQWFYAIVGSNQHDEPWLDEALASYAALLYKNDTNNLTAGPVEDPYYKLTSTVTDFMNKGDEGINNYYYMTYIYGTTALYDLRLLVGDKPFYQTLKQYIRENQYKIATTQEFIKLFERKNKLDLSEYMNEHRITPESN